MGRRLAVFGAVVCTLKVDVPLPTTEAGEKLHELSAGRPAQDALVKLTVPLYPAWPAIVTTIGFGTPRVTTNGVFGNVTVKSGWEFTTIAGEVEAE